ncbi:MAG: type II toxin-antitoxin system VapC family toxin [Chloroflexi bacterium]|nr:type II toxin-antitoxin system VapC family toxin [Chloroflexota bacterium]
MILIDTHIWVWWVNESSQLPQSIINIIESSREDGIGVSIISCWEVAKLVEHNRLKLAYPVEQWINSALNYPSVRLLDLTPKIVVESTQLPGNFHKDPADQLIVATARFYDILLLTVDAKIISYQHVMTSSK